MTDASDAPKRPNLTLPPEAAEAVRAAYADHTAILEYGSGGSTVLASEMPGKRVLSIESDKAWTAMMQRWFTANPGAKGTQVTVHHVNIGPTREWGYPDNMNLAKKFPSYALAPWVRDPDFDPDLVLVDGRFRVGCALTLALHAKKPTKLLFDDYQKRPTYHVVEEWFGAPKYHGRMAEFMVEPMPLTLEFLPVISQYLVTPR